ncbi:MAG: hypothetical protein NUV98_00170 [Candidatus Roizmanbacteria bacterium]|nr:hypothetical protein [Candidatus Roizmanbacteria bacterium]
MANREITVSLHPDLKNESAMIKIDGEGVRYKVSLDGIAKNQPGDLSDEDLRTIQDSVLQTGDPEMIQMLDACLSTNTKR